MAVTFGTPVTASTRTSRTTTWSMSGVTSGQPIIVIARATSGYPLTISDTFSTHYTWTKIASTSALAELFIGTGGAGTSGVITATVATGAPTGVGGVAVPCSGASTASGSAAVDRSAYLSRMRSGTLTMTPSIAGDGAVFAAWVESTAASFTASPASPWSDSSWSIPIGAAHWPGSVALYPNPPVSSLSASWTLSSGIVNMLGVLVREATVPSQPTAVMATPGNGQASVVFTAPSNNGGAAITGYTVTANTGQTATGSSSPIVVSGLTNGTPVTFTVKAVNSSGTSAASVASTAVTPGTVPGVPTILTSGGGNTTAALSWEAPTDGGAVITGYNVYQGTSSGGESTTPVNGSPISGLSYVVTGLTNLTEYYFKVKAINTWGASSPSNEVGVTPAVRLTIVAAPSLTATAVTDLGAPVITLTVTNNQEAITGVVPTAFVTILRTEGTYVIGASPSDPLMVPVPVALTLYVTKTLTADTAALVSTSDSTTPTPTHSGGRIGTTVREWGVGLGAARNTAPGTTAKTLNGAIWMATTLSGKRIRSGRWSATVRLRTAGTTATGTLGFAAFRKNGSTYIPIGAVLSPEPITIETSFETFTITGTFATAAAFGPTEQLYVGFIFNGDSGSTADTMLKVSVGGAYAKIVTPGYVTPPGAVASVIDRMAPYGVQASYTAFVTYGGAISAPSLAAKAIMGQAPDTVALYHRLGWAQEKDTSGILLQWLSGIGSMLQGIDSLCRDSYDNEGNLAPGWSQVLDIDRCPTEALPWLAQFLGVQLNTNLRDDQQRYAIENPQGFARGTPAAILAAVNQYLSAGYSAVLVERDTSAYHLAIRIPTAGIAGLSTCASVYLTYTTCSALLAGVSTCAAMWKIPGEISAAVQASIPAGLVASVSYD